jgi:hypothetical protein
MINTFDLANLADNDAVVNSSTIPASSLEIPNDLIVLISAFFIGEIIFDFPHPRNMKYEYF